MSLIVSCAAHAARLDSLLPNDSLAAGAIVAPVAIDIERMATIDTTVVKNFPKVKPKKTFKKVFSSIVSYLFDCDSNYVEPNHYKFQTFLQNRLSYEAYRVSDDLGNSVTFSPKPSLKIGPSAGWSLLFYGYTIDVLHLKTKDNRTETDISLYTIPLGIDIFYRKSGNEYRINNIKLASGRDASVLNKRSFEGIKSSVKGLNLYYIINHKKFSYPAAFNQSTQQKKSAGSPLVGAGYTQHSLEIDWNKLNDIIKVVLDDSITTEKVKERIIYTDISISGGYAYNWVFAKNWLFAASLSLSLSYKRTSSRISAGIGGAFVDFADSFNFDGFKLSDLTLDGTGRFGIVWTNLRWFAGASVIVHSYNYSKAEFYTNNIFGSFMMYGGVNFGVKKKYKKKKPAPNYDLSKNICNFAKPQ